MTEPGSGSKSEEKAVGSVSISTGDVQGSQIMAAGGDMLVENAQASAQIGISGEELAKAFAAIYKQIEVRPPAPDIDREEIKETVEKIEAEVKKGDEVNVSKVERWLSFLGQMAPDILEVTAATLASPIAGVGAIIRNVAKKAKEWTTNFWHSYEPNSSQLVCWSQRDLRQLL